MIILTVEEIEVLASKGGDIPGYFASPEKMLFIALRALHAEYRTGMITRDKARQEKALLISEYRKIAVEYGVISSDLYGEIVKYNGSDYIFTALIKRKSIMQVEIKDINVNSVIIVRLEDVKV